MCGICKKVLKFIEFVHVVHVHACHVHVGFLLNLMKKCLKLSMHWSFFDTAISLECKAQPHRALLGYPFHNTAAHTEAMPTREGI